MRRLLLAALLTTSLGGCIRHEFDLCAETPPHPDCSDAGDGTDAGPGPTPDAGTDAGSDAGSDAGTDAGSDAGTDAGSDAGTDAG
ncbi:MAG: hypothetical protein H6719_10030 [Sandaracinaceae bacterium]|nr:hypothetical protein [Sandaracinaceae bacterium]